MKLTLMIGSGSFIGGILRYLLSQYIQVRNSSLFPWGTLAVNIMGCLLIGVVFGLAEKGNMTQTLKLFLTTGILGGFTTFSAFSVETFTLLRSGQQVVAIAYIGSSVLIGLLATFIGISLGKAFL
jgi:CrcB protein